MWESKGCKQMFLGTQYYRAPFPNQKYWADDFARIRDCGIDAVQLWALWGWIESTPGAYSYDDYDELMTLADKKGLRVVLSTIAEIHPFWIHRVIPDSHMIDHLGRAVVSCCRVECNVGLTPGGCFDHPKVSDLMGSFLTNVAGRYRNATNLIGWDCWNELRWSVHADGHVCFCPSTIRQFHSWLGERHGGLAGLNKAWQRRYCSWEDVYPAKMPGLPYTDMIEFLRFLTVRAAKHAKFRYDRLREGDPKRIISAHCGSPSISSYGVKPVQQALSRGVDWDLADHLDGFGCSHFPFWGAGFDEYGFGVRVESTRSASQGKTVWVSELQGGSARQGIEAHRSVPAGPQQRWVANGMARGAKAVIFWCWRDEVFGKESSGFGLNGWDGSAQQRLTAMKKMGKFIKQNDKLIEAYRPDPARVGVLFVPDNHMLNWAETGWADMSVDSVVGYAMALERLKVPYDFVEAHHLKALEHLDVLFMPWCLILPEATRQAVERFIKRGGVVLSEAETDSFDELGFYRYPDERPFMQAIGIQDLGRRKFDSENPTISAQLDEDTATLMLGNFLTPLKAQPPAQVLAADGQGKVLLIGRKVGKGRAHIVGSFLGQNYCKKRNEGFEKLVKHVLDQAGVVTDFDIDAGDGNDLIQWRADTTGKARLLWIINGGGKRQVTITDRAKRFGTKPAVTELLSGKSIKLRTVAGQKQCSVALPAEGFVVLRW